MFAPIGSRFFIITVLAFLLVFSALHFTLEVAILHPMASILAHRIFESDAGQWERTAFILHGIWGSGRNWTSMAKRLVRAYPRWRFITVDLPGHGESRMPPGHWTVARCAEALADLAAHHPPEVVIGHSFGGKVALAYGERASSTLVSIWVLDSPLDTGQTATGNETIRAVSDAINTLPIPAPSRESVVEHFTSRGLEKAVAFWMTTNLRRETDGFHWRFQPALVEALLHDYARVDGWMMLESLRKRLSIHLVLAGRSTWWRSGAETRLAGMDGIKVHRFPNAGHWVHVDDPAALVSRLADLDGI